MGWTMRSVCPFRRQWELAQWAADYFDEPLSKWSKVSLKNLRGLWYSIANKPVKEKKDNCVK